MNLLLHIGPLLLVHSISASTITPCLPLDEPFVSVDECNRECDGIPKNCYLCLHIERYSVLGPACGECENGNFTDCFRPQCITADGYKRAVIVANRKFPSPPIQICQYDSLVVDIKNQMPDETTSIHWHGLRHTKNPFFDGVPYVTQCPILPATTFRYRFVAADPGTFFYHSHTGTQKLDGLSGPLIVRQVKSTDKYRHLYDVDSPSHIIVLNDWTHIPAEHVGSPGLHLEDVNQAPESFLINGKGRNWNVSSNIRLPEAQFVVEKGLRYRFRIVGSTCMTCGAALSFEGHRVTAISTDGGLYFKPVEVDTIYFNSADRFDVILNANQSEGVYKITLKGFNQGCEELEQTASLIYTNSEFSNDVTSSRWESKSQKEDNVVLNDFSSNCNKSSSGNYCLCDLEGVSNAPARNSSENYHQIRLDLDMYDTSGMENFFNDGRFIGYDEPVKNLVLKPVINRISFVAPPSPLMSQFNEIPKSSFCSDECVPGKIETFCSCPAVYEVKLNSVVDVIVTDQGDGSFSHPFHLHGYNFYVLEMRGDISNWDEAIGNLKSRLSSDAIDLKNVPQKDSLSIPPRGYAAIRFVADNPGFWIFHCHFAFHLEGGMAGILKVGELENFPPTPNNFPRCGNFP